MDFVSNHEKLATILYVAAFIASFLCAFAMVG